MYKVNVGEFTNQKKSLYVLQTTAQHSYLGVTPPPEDKAKNTKFMKVKFIGMLQPYYTI